MFGRYLDRILDRALDRALEASEQRHQAFVRELAGEQGEREERRERLELEMEQRYRDEVQITREFMRRNELVFQEGMRTLGGLVEVTRELRDDIRAQRQAILSVLDRLENGGEAAT